MQEYLYSVNYDFKSISMQRDWLMIKPV